MQIVREVKMHAVAMRILVLATFLAPVCAQPAGAVPGSLEGQLASLPSYEAGDAQAPQTYRLEYRFFNRDVAGATGSRTCVTADYTRGLEGNMIRWSNVLIASADGADTPMPVGDPLEVMDGFQYGISEEIVQESLYERFPANDLRDLVKTMVWDGMMIEMFDMMLPGFDQLTLNEFHPVPEYDGFEVEMCEWGSLKMRDLNLKWSGVSRVNDEPCALVLYQSMSNPVDAFAIKGRSCYWGQVWISLEDWQIECLTMNEDVVLEVPAGDGESHVLDIQRQIRFEKMD